MQRDSCIYILVKSPVSCSMVKIQCSRGKLVVVWEQSEEHYSRTREWRPRKWKWKWILQSLEHKSWKVRGFQSISCATSARPCAPYTELVNGRWQAVSKSRLWKRLIGQIHTFFSPPGPGTDHHVYYMAASYHVAVVQCKKKSRYKSRDLVAA